MSYSLNVKAYIINNNLINKSTALEIPEKKFDEYATEFVRAFNKSKFPGLEDINRETLTMKEFYDGMSAKEQGLANKILRGTERMDEIRQHLSNVSNWDASIRNRESVVTKYLANKNID